MECKIDLGCWNGVFAVPNDVVDKYIKLASGVSVKVLLVLLRNSGNRVSTADISRQIGVSEEDVKDAVVFWQQMCVLSESYELADAHYDAGCKRTPVESVADIEEQKEQIAAARRNAALRTPDFSPIDIVQTIKSDKGIDFLFKTTEKLYGRSLKHTEQNALVCIVDEIGLPAEVAMMMVNYCFSIGKGTPSYMKSVAVNWVEDGVTTLSSAEERISELELRRGAESVIKKVFGISRALSQKEKEFSDLWINKWKFSEEMIRYAYDINVDAKGKFTFAYIGKILENWYSDGISTVESAAERRDKNKSRFAASSLNLKEIEESFFDDYE